MIRNAKSHTNGSKSHVLPNVKCLIKTVSIKVKIRYVKNNLFVDSEVYSEVVFRAHTDTNLELKRLKERVGKIEDKCSNIEFC